METSIIRLASQVFLVGWCVATAAVMLSSRGRMLHAAGLLWAVFGLACFGTWMFLSALTIKDTELFPRGSLVWLFAIAEAGAAAGAWGWLLAHVHRNFRIHIHTAGSAAK